MQFVELNKSPCRGFTANPSLLSSILLLLCVAGCGGNDKTTSTPPPPPPPVAGPQNYFAPNIVGTTNGGNNTLAGDKIFAIDDSGNVFSESTFQLSLPAQQGPQVINVGVTSLVQRGLLGLGITTNYAPSTSTGTYVSTSYDPPKPGSFAAELAGQAGGFVELVGQPGEPLVAATQCPSAKSTQTYQFITIPAPLIDSSVSGLQISTWDPKQEPAYGSVDISSDGVNITFNNIHQSTLPSAGGSGVPAHPPASPQTGACGPTVLGATITVPGQLSIQDPGTSTPASPQDTIGIGPTGLLVEATGDHIGASNAGPVLLYPPVLGAGSGVVGLPKPSSALDVGSLRDAQYLGYVYGAGTFSGSSSWSSHLASFGFATVPSSCGAVAAGTGTLIYGGDYANDDPTQSSNGFGNCDLAIDFGTQDSANNGLFPNATVWFGASYAANMTKSTSSFPAVAIAGQLNGKNAVFVIGVDSTQPWMIYLLQSN